MSFAKEGASIIVNHYRNDKDAKEVVKEIIKSAAMRLQLMQIFLKRRSN